MKKQNDLEPLRYRLIKVTGTRVTVHLFDKRNYIAIHSTCNSVAQPPSPPHKGMLANIIIEFTDLQFNEYFLPTARWLADTLAFNIMKLKLNKIYRRYYIIIDTNVGVIYTI
uniref:Uncharacterized protein n=1 Tax=Glossina austeni TaxID=7395 RepID=A0A1A9VHG2_GLOAU